MNRHLFVIELSIEPRIVNILSEALHVGCMGGIHLASVRACRSTPAEWAQFAAAGNVTDSVIDLCQLTCNLTDQLAGLRGHAAAGELPTELPFSLHYLLAPLPRFLAFIYSFTLAFFRSFVVCLFRHSVLHGM